MHDHAPNVDPAPAQVTAPDVDPRQAAGAPAAGDRAAGEPLPPVPDWLDEVEGERALAWVEQRNEETRAAYADDPGFTGLAESIESILDSPDRIPMVSERTGMLYNFWTDAEHPRGLWRRTTWLDYASGAPGGGGEAPEPQWEVLLDLDALGREEGRTWVWHGAQVLDTGPRAGRRALVTLSEGGSDADITREFDLEKRRFIPAQEGGFLRPASKGSMSWADEEGESVLLVTDLGEGSLTHSGYPRQVRRMRRDQCPEQAEVLGTAATAAVAASAFYDYWGRTWLATAPDFYSTRIWLVDGGAEAEQAGAPQGRSDGAQGEAPKEGITAPGSTDLGSTDLGSEEESVPRGVRLEVPESAQVGMSRDWLTVELREPWRVGGHTYAQGSLLAAPLQDFLRGERHLTVLFEPTASISLADASWSRSHLILTVLDDVVPRLEILTPPPMDAGHQPWDRHGLDPAALGQVPRSPVSGSAQLRPRRALVTLSASPVNARHGDELWLSLSGWTTPATLAVARIGDSGRVEGCAVLRRAPARFDAQDVEVSQHVAVSRDGTPIPYFQVGRPAPEGSPAPTILYGYGGFEHSLLPHYQPVMGRAWLERGGMYAVANIRGGGEYGPAWHQAALRDRRLRAYEDFAAVAQSLSERGVTSPERLAVHGGSNGGLLTGVMLTRYPRLIGAVVCEVPLLDMSRYHRLLAGHSWMAEYGDPDDPAQWEFIREFSPFHLLRAGRRYPPLLLVTSTRDDRVHPAHARSMAHRMRQLGQEVTYFENSEGGHGAASTNAQRAFMSALTYEFCWRTLSAAPGDSVPGAAHARDAHHGDGQARDAAEEGAHDHQ
ncbi:prolyl oligopeptidase family serine peptidase [Actinomyces bowdenii]|uniref:S9 family peptidase n=1 Tax=Actinomyces bowdenii TaxID=131109 RepID=A0A853ELX4_9ACTO|nr:prolyl oligopeptidase family serine peptidase [Actinomyces bowdenii]MBF0698065.1 S9 family peptidase [Actinomyces bowdenii]NYS70238.1 S9 family peptidase [Actinomyces bowdenii]